MAPIASFAPTPVTGAVDPLASQPASLNGGNLTSGLIDALPGAMQQSPMTPVPKPTLSLGDRANQALGGLQSAGSAITQNPGTALSVLQGVGGAIAYATSQKPKPLNAPAPYTPNIRGAQGIEASSYNQARQDLLSTQTIGATADSSDVSGGVVQRLLAQRQTNTGLTQLAGQNNQAYQMDRARVNAEENAAYGINYNNQRRFAENQYNEQKSLYEARRTQSAAQVQGAVDSISGTYQAKQQAVQLRQEGQNRRTETEITNLHTQLAAATTPEQKAALLDQLKKLDPEGVRTGQASTLYGPVKKLAGGGMIPSGFVTFPGGKAGTAAKGGKAGGKGTGKNALPASVQAVHQLSKDFSAHLDRFSNQARAAFDRSLATATRLRSTPIGSSVSASGRSR